MDATTRIRNLSVAIEALHRVGSCDHEAYDLYKVLCKEVEKLMEKEGLTARPAKPSTDFIPEPFKP